MAYAIKCPVCRKKFSWKPVEGFPEECPNPECNSRIGHDGDDTVIAMPSLRSARMAANDKVYRDIEAKSEYRAQAAADMLGVPVSEMSDMKVTDLRPTTHHGDVAAPPLPAHLQGVGSFSGSGGAEYSQSVQSGPLPNMGAKMRTMLHRQHEAATHGKATSERPALETTQPGYRIRG